MSSVRTTTHTRRVCRPLALASTRLIAAGCLALALAGCSATDAGRVIAERLDTLDARAVQPPLIAPSRVTAEAALRGELVERVIAIEDLPAFGVPWPLDVDGRLVSRADWELPSEIGYTRTDFDSLGAPPDGIGEQLAAWELRAVGAIHALLGPGVWDRPGALIELTREGLRLRHTEAVVGRAAEMLGRVGASEKAGQLVEVATRLMVIEPDALRAMPGLFPLPHEGTGVGAVLTAAGATAWLDQVEAAGLALDIGDGRAQVVSSGPGRRSRVRIMRERSYAAAYLPASAAAGAGPVVRTDRSGLFFVMRGLPVVAPAGVELALTLEVVPALPLIDFALAGGARTAQLRQAAPALARLQFSIPEAHTLITIIPGITVPYRPRLDRPAGEASGRRVPGQATTDDGQDISDAQPRVGLLVLAVSARIVDASDFAGPR